MSAIPDEDASMWHVHGRRSLYASEWVELWLDDVEIPGGARFEHHVLRFPKQSVYILAVDRDKILLLWRHRFITKCWGWEVPAGWVDPGESSFTAAQRELREETGCDAESMELLTEYNALSGISDMHFSVYLANGVVPTPGFAAPDASESARREWIPLEDLASVIKRQEVKDGPSMLALTYYLALRHGTESQSREVND